MGTGYTLSASDGTLSGVTSNPFNITPASANRLAITAQPTNTMAGQTISSVTVKVFDLFGNVVTSDSSSVTVAIGTNPGGGMLSGTATVNAVNGVATFSTLSIDNHLARLGDPDVRQSGPYYPVRELGVLRRDDLAYLPGVENRRG